MMGLVIDNFAGGGGASTGIEAAIGRPVDVAINHDEAAIAVHAANHPDTVHYCQSIFAVDPLDATGGQSVDLAWFSPDCKHHSKAKGGKPRDKNIRDMAWVVPHWIERLKAATVDRERNARGGAPRVIMLENVEEFRQWGPLDENGKPIKDRQGEEFDLWVRRIRKHGYTVEWRELRACDYGAPTSRKRLFLIARCDGRPIVWPDPTHGAPDSEEVLAGRRLPWRTAAECIDWSIECPSIFERKRSLKEATCKRIAAGVMRYVVDSARPFIIGTDFTNTRASRVFDPEDPLRTVTAQNSHAVAAPVLSPFYGEKAGGKVRACNPVDEPLRTATCEPRIGLISAFLHKYRPNSIGSAMDAPMPTVTANSFVKRGGGAPPMSLVSAHIEQANGGPRNEGAAGHDVRKPMSTVTVSGSQQRLVETTMIEADALAPDLMAKAVRTAAFLVKYYGNEDGGHGLDDPMGTVTTRDRFAVVTVTIDAATYVLVDIGMRMLTPRELANAQGFPPDYILDPVCTYRTDAGNLKTGPLPKSHQIAKIGNAVCPPMSEALVRANLPELCRTRRESEAA